MSHGNIDIAVRQNHDHGILSTRFCTAGGDKKLRCFSVDLKNNSTVQMLDGHESYINDCVFNPVQGDAIASVSGKYLQGLGKGCCIKKNGGKLWFKYFYLHNSTLGVT